MPSNSEPRSPNILESDLLVQNLIFKASMIQSPDDLEVQQISNEIMRKLVDKEQYETFCTKLYQLALNKRTSTTVVVAICNIIGMNPVGSVKMRNIFLKHLQQEFFVKKEEVAKNNWSEFVTSTIFLGESCCRKLEFLCEAVMDCLIMILEKVLSSPDGSNIDEDLLVVARQLHLNGPTYSQKTPDQLGNILKMISEVLIVKNLNSECRLNLLTVLASLWPLMHNRLHPSSAHATIAAKLGLSLKL